MSEQNGTATWYSAQLRAEAETADRPGQRQRLLDIADQIDALAPVIDTAKALVGTRTFQRNLLLRRWPEERALATAVAGIEAT